MKNKAPARVGADGNALPGHSELLVICQRAAGVLSGIGERISSCGRWIHLWWGVCRSLRVDLNLWGSGLGRVHFCQNVWGLLLRV